jgi:hypothetical protein
VSEPIDRRSPYLLLGVDYGAGMDAVRKAFARRVRTLRRSPDAPYTMEDMNWALHKIEAAKEAPEVSLDHFRVPANRATMPAPAEGDLFSPAPVPLPRLTPPPTTEELDGLAVQTLRDGLDRIIDTAAAARRGDPTL